MLKIGKAILHTNEVICDNIKQFNFTNLSTYSIGPITSFTSLQDIPCSE